MSEKTLIDAIKHYQNDIERCPDNKERMLRCIKRLYVMPIKVEHLHVTGVGRSVNNLREVAGEVGDAATALVAKWKAMVTAEDVDYEEDSSAEEEEDELQAVKDQSDNRISPDNDQSIKDKENIRLNHRTDKIKNDKSEKTEKSEKTSKLSEKHSKDNKSYKHSSKEKESSSKKDNPNKNHSSSSSRDKKDKDKNLERHKESSKSEHKSSSEKDKKRKDEKDKNHSKSRDKHSSKDKEVTKEIERSKHSSSSSRSKDKDKISSSKDKDAKKDKSSDSSKDHKEKIPTKEKRSNSPDRKKDSRKSEKRKHHTSHRDNETPVKKIKKEKLSSDEEQDSDSCDDNSESDQVSNRNSDSENEIDRSSDNERTDHSEEERSESEEMSEPESFSKIQIKQEPLSDSGSEQERPRKKFSHHESNHKSSSSSKHRRSDDMRPPSSSSKSDNLKALIKENEKKIKKEKVDSSEKAKKNKVKIELNQDGSIDSGSGASFADALMGFDKPKSGSPKKKKKREEKPKESSSRMSTVSSATGSSSGPSRSPSQCSTSSSYRSSSSPFKQDKKPNIQDISREAPEALLKKPVKLEPLNLDISSTLPEISTNYKPLPSINLSRHAPQQAMSEEEMFSIMTSKNQRTKVYSGYKYGHTASVPTLYSFCIQVLYDNIDGLEYTGGVPFEILKPLLIKLNADQLLNLEHYNPYLVIDTDDLWKFHCNKTFPKASRDDMDSWREIYLRCMDERELKLKRLTANITESMAIKGPARQAKLAYVDSVAKPPRSIARKQARYGTGSTSPVASTSSSNISQIAAAQNQAKKKEIMSKAVVGGYTPAAQATEQVPSYNNPATAAKILKKKKAPLMAKALQLIKGNHRFKR